MIGRIQIPSRGQILLCVIPAGNGGKSVTLFMQDFTDLYTNHTKTAVQLILDRWRALTNVSEVPLLHPT